MTAFEQCTVIKHLKAPFRIAIRSTKSIKLAILLDSEDIV